MLTRNIRYQTYAFSLDTRSSVFGAVIAVAGIVVVLLRAVLKVLTVAEEVDTMELMAAALAHEPQVDERDALRGMTKNEVAGLRWRGVGNRMGGEGEEEDRGKGAIDFEIVRTAVRYDSMVK